MVLKPLLKIASLSLLLFLVHDIPQAQTTNFAAIGRDPLLYLLDKCKRHDVVLLGTKHKQPEILNFISKLIPKLREASVSYLGLEISSDEQPSIDRYLKSGIGLEEISLHYALDCPGYRNLFKILRNLSQKYGLKVIALDLPPLLYQKNYNRDEWMAKSICRVFDQDSNAKIMVIVGNLHTLKRIRWEDHVANKHGFIPSYLSKLKSELKVFSICQLIKNSPARWDSSKNQSENKPVALDCDGSFSDWKLGILENVAAKPMNRDRSINSTWIWELLSAVLASGVNPPFETNIPTSPSFWRRPMSCLTS